MTRKFLNHLQLYPYWHFFTRLELNPDFQYIYHAMHLIFIRHGDPDYSIDNLTEKGKIEAKLLSDIIETFDIDEVYQSPLGRAKATAEYSLKVLGKEVTTLDWLKEFPALFDPNLSDTARMAYSNELRKDPISGKYEKRIVWDILPSYYGKQKKETTRLLHFSATLA